MAPVGYGGIYEVSQCGQVRSLDRVSCTGRKLTGKIRKIVKDSYGREIIDLCKDSRHQNTTIIRIVAMAWVPNHNDLPYAVKINSLGGCEASNIQWATKSKISKSCGTSRGKKLTKANQKKRNSAIRRSKKSVKELAIKFNLSTTTIRRILK